MQRLPPGVGACSACEVADKAAGQIVALRREVAAAIARAERAEAAKGEVPHGA
jgi:hypothetical protein